MKQFEKYWKKHNPQRGILCDDFRRAGYIWRDALRWVLRIKENGDKLAYYNDDILMAIAGEIRKELEE